jgi:hypothetical protein
MRHLIVPSVALLLSGSTATSEQACVKYHRCIPLDELKCETITRSTAIHRVWFKRRDGVDGAPYHFCALGPDVFKEFMEADSMGRF